MNSSINSGDMYREVGWMKPSDQPRLQELDQYDGWQTPTGLSLNVPYSYNWVVQRLQEMLNHGLVEKHPEETGYRVTEKGRDFLAGDLDADGLEDRSDE